MREIKRGSLKFNVREDTLDEWIVDEVLSGIYTRPLEIKRSDVVLDIGMNIGVFSVLAGYLGANIIGYEPEPENFEMAEYNILNNGLGGIFRNAGVSDENKTETLYLNEKKNRGQHSITPVKGRKTIDIKCFDINEILDEHRPNKIKIDCEGEEYKIIMAVTTWGQVDRIVFEWHRKLLKDESNVKFHKVICKLEADGFEVIAKRDGKGWYQFVKCIRK